VSVRIQDASGNWSTVTRTTTVTALPDPIFANGFETGLTPWGWTLASTANTTRVDVTAAAALAATTRGLQIQGNNTNYVQYNFGTAANPATGTYDARFSFNPNGATSTGKDIFTAAPNAAGYGAPAFRVRYRMNGSQSQVQIQVGANNTNTTWVNITSAASNKIEVTWQAGAASGLKLYINGSVTAAQTLNATNVLVGSVRLGSVTNVGNATLMYFDEFASKRTLTPLFG
jgi:hypothetical protein